jgi:hypothetical protein
VTKLSKNFLLVEFSGLLNRISFPLKIVIRTAKNIHRISHISSMLCCQSPLRAATLMAGIFGLGHKFTAPNYTDRVCGNILKLNFTKIHCSAFGNCRFEKVHFIIVKLFNNLDLLHTNTLTHKYAFK